MGAIVLKHNWTRQPQNPFEINWTHPLARGLLYYMPHFAAPAIFDSVSGRVFHGGVEASRRFNKNGVVYYQNSRTLLTGYQPISLAAGQGFSFLFWGNPTASTTREAIITQRSGGFQNEVHLRSNSDSVGAATGVGGGLWFTCLNTNDPSATSFAAGAVDGNYHIFVARRNSDGTRQIFRDGTSVSSVSGTANTDAIAPSDLCLGGLSDSTGIPYTGGRLLDAAWGRGLSFNEIRSLTANPYQFLRPMQRRLWVVGEATAGIDDLTGQNIVTGDQTITSPALGQMHALVVQNVAAGAPTITSLALGQTHALSVQSVAAGAPTVTTPSLSVSINTDNLTGQDIETGQTAVTSPSIAQIHVLGSDGASLGAPIITTPALGQTHELTSQNVTGGAPEISTLSMTPSISLASQGIETAALAISTPAIGQVHALTSETVLVGNLDITAPALGQLHILLGQDVVLGAPFITSAMMYNADFLPNARISLATQVALGFSMKSSVCLGITRKSTTGMNLDME